MRGRLGTCHAALEKESGALLARLGAAAGLDGRHELSLLLTDNATMRRINLRWRRIDRPTDVLSFPLHPIRPGAPAPAGPLGDIVVSLPYVRQAARLEGLDPHRHLALLLAHGLLHLLGYDHGNEREARRMEKEEQRIMEHAAKAGPKRPKGP